MHTSLLSILSYSLWATQFIRHSAVNQAPGQRQGEACVLAKGGPYSIDFLWVRSNLFR